MLIAPTTNKGQESLLLLFMSIRFKLRKMFWFYLRTSVPVNFECHIHVSPVITQRYGRDILSDSRSNLIIFESRMFYIAASKVTDCWRVQFRSIFPVS